MQLKIPTFLRRTSQQFRKRIFHNVIVYSKQYLPDILRVLKEYTRVHQSLIGLTIFILINNGLVVQAANEIPTLPTDLIISDPYQIADTVRLLEDYTPGIDEDADTIALLLEERINGEFINTNPLIATLPGQTEEPSPPPSPSPQNQTAESDKRTKDFKYSVTIGDTISGIGEKFSLKVATLKVKNNLSDIDTIKPGQELIIPPQDLSDKAIKAAEDRKTASAELAKGVKKKIISTAKAGGWGLSVPIRHNGITRRLVGGHTGVDYRANTGTSVMAADDGVVIVADEVGWNGGYGRTVLLSHDSGKTTRYAHMSDVQVRTGQKVSRGQVIGLSGNTGRSTGPHLHFELRINGRAVDPGT